MAPKLVVAALLCATAVLPGAHAVGITPCSENSCRGGACVWDGCTDELSCDGGGCLFTNCKKPSCRGGMCTFHKSHTAICGGGGCHYSEPAHEFSDAEHCPGGSCSHDDGEGGERHERTLSFIKDKAMYAEQRANEQRAEHEAAAREAGAARKQEEGQKEQVRQPVKEPEPEQGEEQEQEEEEEDEEPETPQESLHAAREAGRQSMEENPIPEDNHHVSDEL